MMDSRDPEFESESHSVGSAPVSVTNGLKAVEIKVA